MTLRYILVCRVPLLLLASIVCFGTRPKPASITKQAFPQQATQSPAVPAAADIPIGLDAYRMWERWPEQRIGMRAYMRSTYDRTGGNADASHFLYQLNDAFNVALDLEGPGLLVFSRFNHWHGSPWHFVVDGKDHEVEECSGPSRATSQPCLKPASAFPSPLNLTWNVTSGADLLGTPIPFTRSFTIGYSQTHYGTGYYIYDRFVPGTLLSHPLRSWTERSPDRDVLALIAKAGTDIAPRGRRRSGTMNLPARQSATLVTLRGRAALRALTFSIPRNAAATFENVRLRVTWDHRAAPSIDAPIALFFGAGTLYNRDQREYLVKAFPVHIRFTDRRIELACYFPMPFFQSAKIELVSAGPAVDGIEWGMRTVPLRRPASALAYFHATYRDFPTPTPGKDLVLLDTRGMEGSVDWSGQLVGTSFIFSHAANLSTLEGDPRFFFDDSRTPQVQGTGTEEWGGGGDYWGGKNTTLPFFGHPVGARSFRTAVNEQDKIESAYRFLLADLMPFGKNALIQIEHGGEDESTQHYETIAYWYGLPAASLVRTDQLKIGDPESEARHSYQSPQASAPYPIISRYEWGVDTLNGRETYPPEKDWGRVTTGVSEFRVSLRPDNLGVLLRRKLDYSYPNQRAEVFISNGSHGPWKDAGVWYLAGSNTCVYSNPRKENGPTQHIVQTSNRRFRDDEFLIARRLTRGRKSVWVKIQFTPVHRPLFPGHPEAAVGWSEIQYTAYCFITPRFRLRPGSAAFSPARSQGALLRPNSGH